MIKENTLNKIFFCQYDGTPLNGVQMLYCSTECAELGIKRDQQDTSSGGPKTWAYLNLAMLNVARGNQFVPRRFSAFIHTGHDLMGVAVFEDNQLEQITDAEASSYDAYWRPIAGTDLPFEEYDPEAMRTEGLLAFLQRRGIHAERQIASALFKMAVMEGKDPIQLINSL